jgi:hypothetical protein
MALFRCTHSVWPSVRRSEVRYEHILVAADSCNDLLTYLLSFLVINVLLTHAERFADSSPHNLLKTMLTSSESIRLFG